MLVAVLFFGCKKHDVPDGGLQTKILTNNLNYPWEILWGPDDHIWMTEREGRISRVNPATGDVLPLLSIPDVKTVNNYNGLLGMALHPEFNSNPHVFVVYNYDRNGHFLQKVVRYKYDGNTLIEPMIIVDDIIGLQVGNFIHNGSRLVITPDLKLFITTGDADIPSAPQNLNSKNGKVLRVNLDGTIPADNPFPNNPVWSYGHRNSQGLVYANNTLYNSEHGQDTDDEVNIIQKGGNYGWRNVHGFCDLPDEQTFCDANNVIEPLIVWTPTIAPSGLDYYDKSMISQWKNSFLMCTLKAQKLVQLEIGKQDVITHDFFVNQFGRLRDLCISPEGKVYISTDNGNNNDMIVEVSSKK
jgi:glucose/arabinose dehydrogenase